MKRKIYFIISASLQIILAIYSIFKADKLVNALINAYNSYPEELRDKLANTFQNIGPKYIMGLAIISIILNVIILIVAIRGKLIKNKKAIIACSVFSLLMAATEWAELIAIINIIVIATAKPTDKEDMPKEKEAIPDMKKEKVTSDKILLAIFLFVAYFSQFLWSRVIPDNPKIVIIVSIAFYLLMIVLCISCFGDLLKKHFKMFTSKFKAYSSNLLGTIGKFYLIYFIVAILAVLITKSTAANQDKIAALPIWLSIPLALIYAPIVEETLFRGCIRRFIKNDKVFIAVSAIAFGLLHTVFSETNIFNAIVLALPYMSLGGFLAYLYVKTNNICTNMALHAAHNTIAMLVMLLML